MIGGKATFSALMVFVGAVTTLITKYQDLQCVANCSSSRLSERQSFKQPIWQTDQMFAGGLLCWAIVVLSNTFSKISRRYQARSLARDSFANSETLTTSPIVSTSYESTESIKLYIIALPVLCDIVSSTLLNVGLLFVVPSIYQMVRGSVVFFSALFSVWFLNREIERFKWLALSLVILGTAVVSLAGAMEQDPTSRESPPSIPAIQNPIRGFKMHQLRTTIGVCIVFFAQIFAAAQFIFEESIMSHYPIAPLELVGYEGVSGLIIILFTQCVAHIVYGSTFNGRQSVFDMGTGWYQITHNPHICAASILMMVATGVYGYFALSVTKSYSATHRTTIDAFRTILIWIVGLVFGWESFKWLQLIGFMGITLGNLLFNDVLKPPSFHYKKLWAKENRDEDHGHQLG